MLIEALGTYIKQLGEKTYNILSHTNNDEAPSELTGDIDSGELIEMGIIPDELVKELTDQDKVVCISDIESNDID